MQISRRYEVSLEYPFVGLSIIQLYLWQPLYIVYDYNLRKTII